MSHINKNNFDFSGLFVFDLANNHQGDVEHGKKIIRELAPVVQQSGVRGACKLQFRNLDTFIHPDYKNSQENKHIPRFMSTRLSNDQFAELVAETRANGMVTISTPFDEDSVDLLASLNVDILKIASCSAKDWPLLVKAASTGKPIIASTAGLSIQEIDALVSFLDHRSVSFAIMHCVAKYPTANSNLHLNQVQLLNERYPSVTVGFSTHEDPENLSAIQIAFAKGANLFERHVGVETDTIKLNAYSSTPQQIDRWLKAYHQAFEACGPTQYSVSDPEEQQSLESLARGVYLKRNVYVGEEIKSEDVFFAMPLQPGQMKSGEWSEGVTADKDYAAKQPLPQVIAKPRPVENRIISQTLHEIKAMLNLAKINLGYEFDMELSHHYGIEKFREFGTIIIDCINRDFCKKILIQLPGQVHPFHHHRKKEEMFQLLSGDLEVTLEDRVRHLYPGDKLLVQQGVRHSFRSKNGAIFEEISSTSYTDDSFYEDPEISKKQRSERKTRLVNWGRHQF